MNFRLFGGPADVISSTNFRFGQSRHCSTLYKTHIQYTSVGEVDFVLQGAEKWPFLILSDGCPRDLDTVLNTAAFARDTQNDGSNATYRTLLENCSRQKLLRIVGLCLISLILARIVKLLIPPPNNFQTDLCQISIISVSYHVEQTPKFCEREVNESRENR